ncbi:hypothetical protein RUM43_003245 [Polyplax serrata]|uniref:Large ribosomal subunit protein mL38 n=1 Tax=Polyplax serrata TaxID=468196 RepID=A0AAN8PE75_POLSC
MLSLRNKLLRQDIHVPILSFIRNKRYIFPEVNKSLEEKLAEFNAVDESLHFKVDIGFPPRPNPSVKELNTRRKYINEQRKNAELEKKSRHLQLNLDLQKIKEEWWKGVGPAQIHRLAEHYQIFKHLFGEAYFMPLINMDIYYPQKDEKLVAPVYWGNIVTPTEAFSQPQVKFESNPDELWSLTLVNPDAHFDEPDMEYIHWMVGNIPGGDIEKGEIIWDYLPPFPPRGIGYQRLIFVLYKQEKKISYSKLKKKVPCLELKDRSFKTLEFYRERQDKLTPAGLSFFQCNWDPTARKIFHEILNMEEPIFEYDFDPQPLRKQTAFPSKESFNM